VPVELNLSSHVLIVRGLGYSDSAGQCNVQYAESTLAGPLILHKGVQKSNCSVYSCDTIRSHLLVLYFCPLVLRKFVIVKLCLDSKIEASVSFLQSEPPPAIQATGLLARCHSCLIQASLRCLNAKCRSLLSLSSPPLFVFLSFRQSGISDGVKGQES